MTPTELIKLIEERLATQLDYIIQGTDSDFVSSITSIGMRISPFGRYLLHLSNDSNMNFTYSLEDEYIPIFELLNNSLNTPFESISYQVHKGLLTFYVEDLRIYLTSLNNKGPRLLNNRTGDIRYLPQQYLTFERNLILKLFSKTLVSIKHASLNKQEQEYHRRSKTSYRDSIQSYYSSSDRNSYINRTDIEAIERQMRRDYQIPHFREYDTIVLDSMSQVTQQEEL